MVTVIGGEEDDGLFFSGDPKELHPVDDTDCGLPDGEPTSVEYHYPNGDIYYIDKEMLANFKKNLVSSGSMYVMHGGKFLEIIWKKKQL